MAPCIQIDGSNERRDNVTDGALWRQLIWISVYKMQTGANTRESSGRGDTTVVIQITIDTLMI